MNINFSQFKRHIRHYFEYAFLVFSIISIGIGQDDISINQFDKPLTNFIPFQLDQTGQNTLYFNFINPYLSSDINSGFAILDGSLGYPLGAYYIHEIDFLDIGKTDSSHVVSELLYRQGDYLLRETGIGLGKLFENGNSLEFRGFGRSFSGRFGEVGNGSNILQNYRMDYNGKVDETKIGFSYGYHIEEVGVSLDNSFFNEDSARLSESMFGGIEISHTSNSFDIEIQSAFHVSHILDSTYKTIWNNATLNTQFETLCQLVFDISTKRRNTQFNEIEYVKPSIQLAYSNGITSIKAGLNYVKSVEPVFTMKYKFNENMSFHLISDNDVSFNHLAQDRLTYFTSNSVGFNYENNNVSIFTTICLLETDSETIPSISLHTSYLNSWMSINNTTVAFNSDAIWFNGYSQTSLKISPQFAYKRFRPYAKIDGTIWSSTGNSSLDYNENTFLFELNDISNTPLITNNLNFEFGFILQSFQVAYKMTNILQNPIMQPSNLNPIEPMNYLEVIWLFND